MTPNPPKPVDLGESVAGEEDPGASVDMTVPSRTGKVVCPACGGSGMQSGETCNECKGAGTLVAGTGGA